MSNSFVTPWTVAHQAPLSIGFPRQEYWSGLPFPSPGDLPNPKIEPVSLSPALAGGFLITSATFMTVGRKKYFSVKGRFPKEMICFFMFVFFFLFPFVFLVGRTIYLFICTGSWWHAGSSTFIGILQLPNC